MDNLGAEPSRRTWRSGSGCAPGERGGGRRMPGFRFGSGSARVDDEQDADREGRTGDFGRGGAADEAVPDEAVPNTSLPAVHTPSPCFNASRSVPTSRSRSRERGTRAGYGTRCRTPRYRDTARGAKHLVTASLLAAHDASSGTDPSGCQGRKTAPSAPRDGEAGAGDAWSSGMVAGAGGSDRCGAGAVPAKRCQTPRYGPSSHAPEAMARRLPGTFRRVLSAPGEPRSGTPGSRPKTPRPAVPPRATAGRV